MKIVQQDLKERAGTIVRELKKLFPQVKSALQYSNPLEFLIAVILSAQCTDVMVNKVTVNLFQKYKTLNDYCRVNLTEFQHDIRSIGLYRNKAKHILATAHLIKDQFYGQIPATMEELLELPGVGRKTANVVLGVIYHKPVGIAVDTHVRRLAKLYGLTHQTNPEAIERDLVKIIPQREWIEFTLRMIEYGRKYCPARTHDHDRCPLTLALRIRGRAL